MNRDVDGKLVIGTEINNKQFEAQVKVLERKLNDIESSLKMASEDKTLFSTREIEEMEAEAEKLRNKLIQIRGGVEDAGDESSKRFKKGINSLKKFGLSLFSIRSIYSLVSKASSAWLSQDTELANKLQSVWVGLGSFLAPALEYISDIMLKLLGYFNVFIKALTGVDYIARANAKSLNKQAQAQKNLNKATQQYDFDVIRTQQDTSSTGAGGGIDTSGLINIPELDESIVKKLQDMAKWLKENWYWLKEVGKIFLIVFGIAKIKKIVSNLALLIGTKGGATGLAGIETGLLAIAAVLATKWAVDNWKNLIQGINDTKESLEGTKKQAGDNKTSFKDLNDRLEKYTDDTELGAKAQKLLKNNLNEANESFKNQTKECIEGKNWLGELTGTNKQFNDIIDQEKDKLAIATDKMIKMKDENKLTKDEIDNFSSTLRDNIKYLEDNGINADDLKLKYEKLTGKTWEATIDVEDKATKKAQTIWDKIKEIFSNPINTIVKATSGVMRGAAQKGYARGGIVTQPTRALIGEAGYPEAVLPLTDEYLKTLAGLIGQFNNGSRGNNITNVYLNGRLIQRQVSQVENEKDFATNN